MTLSVDIRHQLGVLKLDAKFVTDGGLVALFGQSGSGKTSIVNVIAGLIRPDSARVKLGDVTLIDTDAGVFVPAHKRRIGYVFQEGRLFPHLTVKQNLLYGRWFAANRSLAEAGQPTLERVVDLLGIGALLERKPTKLSGGEKQRVAIGRALLTNPRLLLMDEPLASLDEGRKAEILPYIERLRDSGSVPIVYVSHALSEVTRLATSVVLLADGKVVAAGPTQAIMQRLDLIPLTGQADAGAVVEATVAGHDAQFGLTELTSRAGTWRLPLVELPVGAPLRIRVRARDVMLAKQLPQEMSALNVMRGVVSEVGAPEGAVVEVRIDCNGESLVARLTRYSVETLKLEPGTQVYALIKSVAFDRRGLSGPLGASADADVSAS